MNPAVCREDLCVSSPVSLNVKLIYFCKLNHFWRFVIKYSQDIGLIKKRYVMHYFINKNSNCHFDSQMQHLTRVPAFPPLLAWLQPAGERRTNSWVNLSELFTVKYITFASCIRQILFFFVRKQGRTVKSFLIFLNTF